MADACLPHGSIPQVLAEVISRARLHKRIAPDSSGIQMHQLMAVEVAFSLSTEQVVAELLTALRSIPPVPMQQVLAEMRADADAVEAGEQAPVSAGMVRKWADRIEAALRSLASPDSTAVVQRRSMSGASVRYLIDGHDETLAFSTTSDAGKVWELLRRLEALASPNSERTNEEG